MPRLDGKVVVITGSAGGIGRHVAKTYAQAGANVVVADVKPLDTVAAELKSLEGAYRLSPKGSGTDVTYELSVDLIIPMIGLLKRKAERRLTDTALKDLKKRAEAE